jgi:hypothetical protein
LEDTLLADPAKTKTLNNKATKGKATAQKQKQCAKTMIKRKQSLTISPSMC